jgi:hypothetical protein
MRDRRWLVGLAAAGCALLLACGDDESVATGAAMGEAPARDVPSSSAVNSAPVIDGITLSPPTPRPGERITAQVRASDPDGDDVRIRYEWRVDGTPQSESGASLHVAGETGKSALIEVTATVTDSHDESSQASASARIGNLPPILQGVVLEPLGEVTAGHDVVATPRAMDPDGDELDFHYRWDVNGRTVETESAVLEATRFKRGDSIVLTVSASDGQDESDPIRSDPIQVVNSPPRVTSTPGAFDDEGVFRYKIEVEDPDGDHGFRYRLLEGPEGLVLDGVDGQITWIPTEAQAGRHPVKIEVMDAGGASATQSFVISLGFGEEPPPADAAEE